MVEELAARAWEREHFSLQAVDAYPEYKATAKQCTNWTAPVSLAHHTLEMMRAKYPFEKSEAALRAHSRRFFAGCDPNWDLMVQTCMLPLEDEGNGIQNIWTFTRVGPTNLGPDAYLCIALIPKMPTEPTTTFVSTFGANIESYTKICVVASLGQQLIQHRTARRL